MDSIACLVSRIGTILSKTTNVEVPRDILPEFVADYFRKGYGISDKYMSFDECRDENAIFTNISVILKSIGVQWLDMMFHNVDDTMEFFSMFSDSDSLKENRKKISTFYNWILENKRNDKNDNIDVLQKVFGNIDPNSSDNSVRLFSQSGMELVYSDTAQESSNNPTILTIQTSTEFTDVLNSYLSEISLEDEDCFYNSITHVTKKIISQLTGHGLFLNNDFLPVFKTNKITDFPIDDFVKISIINKLMHIEDRPWSCMYFFPISASRSNLIGNFSCVTNKKLDKEQRILLRLLINSLLNPFTQQYHFQVNYHTQRRSAIKSAKAAIMSRNMSHNLGSHVMAYLKQSLSSVEDIIKHEALADLIPQADNFDITSIKERIAALNDSQNNIELPFLIGLGKFIRYLQERQDFIATIATGYIPQLTTVNFKDFIYDELNPDYRYERHKEDRSGHKPHNILLDTIAKSEGYNRNKINIKFRGWNGTDKEKVNEIEQDHTTLKDLRKINIGLPGGVVGRQAIFSIIENIIRNAAKHGKSQDEQERKLIIDIDIYDFFKMEENDRVISDENDFYRFLKRNSYLSQKSKEELLVVTFTDNKNIDGKSFEKLKKAISEAYINEDGSMVNTNKGIKEMKISAAWLRNISNEENLPEGEPPILDIFRTKDDNLRYVFCLKAPQKLAVVTQKKLGGDSREVRKKLEDESWEFFTVQEYKKLSSKNFELTVFEEGIIEGQDQTLNRLRIPSRFLEIQEKKLLDTINNNDAKEAETILWKTYIESQYDYNEEKLIPTLHIEDEKLYASLIHKNESKEFVPICNNKVVVYHKIPDAQDEETLFLYRTHHNSTEQLEEFLKLSLVENKYSNIENEFVESISGHNSTDRIIRNEEKNDVWYFKQVDIAKKKIAIFDERLFQKLAGKGDIDIHNDIAGTELATIYLQKGVSVFNIIENGKNRFDIFGFSTPTERQYTNRKVKTKAKAYIYKFGEVLVEKDGIKIVSKKDGLLEYFDFASIHQGLLDKIYSCFDGLNKDNNKTIKSDITAKFENFYLRSNKLSSKLIIHSGRSRPSEKDMPQELPFLQYAAIENAFEDSKYLLVELLTFAIYEDNYNI